MDLKLLVVDDHPIFRDGVAAALKQLAAAPCIDTATSVASAIEAIERCDYDLVLVDLMMPGESGLNLLASLQESASVVPAVAMSGESDLPLVSAALSNGSLGFIPKTLETGELVAAVQTVLRGEIFLPTEYRRQLLMAGDEAVPAAAQELGITPRQYAVLQHMAEGLGNREIAEALSLTENTVKTHSKALFAALGVRNRTACVARARSHSLVSQKPV